MSNKKKTRTTKTTRVPTDEEILEVMRDLEDNYGWKFLRDLENPGQYTILRKGRLP